MNLQAKPAPPLFESPRELLPLNAYLHRAVGSEECENTIAMSALRTSKKQWRRASRTRSARTTLLQARENAALAAGRGRPG